MLYPNALIVKLGKYMMFLMLLTFGYLLVCILMSPTRPELRNSLENNSHSDKRYNMVRLNDLSRMIRSTASARIVNQVFDNLFKAQNLKLLTDNPRPVYPIFPFDLEDPNSDDRILFQLSYVPRNVILNRHKGTQRYKTIQFYDQQNRTSNLSLCPVFECHFKYGTSDWSKADLLVLRDTDQPLGRRPWGQPWILSLLESPDHTNPLDFFTETRKVNFTATYRRDSTLVTPYYKYVAFETSRTNPSRTRSVNYASGKTKQVAWFVSNCDSKAPRQAYALELKKFISVDIYGGCGNLTCSNNLTKCFNLIEKDYKFYLSFENSLCQDYITEKFYLNALEHKALPVVMGASRQEYERVSPTNSFVHVNDFSSAKALAQYLDYLDQNDTAYNAYFEWRHSGRLDFNSFTDCRLCMLAHELEHISPTWYDDVHEWWFQGCQNREPVRLK